MIYFLNFVLLLLVFVCTYYYIYGIFIYFCSPAGAQLFLLPLALVKWGLANKFIGQQFDFLTATNSAILHCKN
jgi:hypothetical protein